jgi:hypothetical protein
MARPFVHSPEKFAIITTAVASGMTRSGAAGLAGVTAQTALNWYNRGLAGETDFVEFAAALERADGVIEQEMTSYITQAARGEDPSTSLRAAQFWLERRRTEYRPASRNEVSGPDGGAIEINATPEHAAALVRQMFGSHGAKKAEESDG